VLVRQERVGRDNSPAVVSGNSSGDELLRYGCKSAYSTGDETRNRSSLENTLGSAAQCPAAVQVGLVGARRAHLLCRRRNGERRAGNGSGDEDLRNCLVRAHIRRMCDQVKVVSKVEGAVVQPKRKDSTSRTNERGCNLNAIS
jgi:hypothetical protein